MLSKRRPLEILIEEAELSEGSGDECILMPPTPPRPPSLNPPTVEVQQQTEGQTDSNEQCIDQEEDDEDSDEEEDFVTLKSYYDKAVAKSNRENSMSCFATI